LGVCFIVIGARAFQLHVLDGEQLQSKAADRYTREFDNKPKRGTIYDRNHAELALSVDVPSICAYPPKIESPEETATALARVLKVKQAPLRRKLASKRGFIWVKRHAVPAEVSAVEALNIDGVDFVTESRRYYPMKSLAAQVIGFCNVDGKGLEGLEFYYNGFLEGRETSVTVLRDALGRNFTEEEPSFLGTPGYNLILNIDKNVQYIAEQALSEGVRAARARTGTALVVDPGTGAVLAVAHVPQFNPNAFSRYGRERWRNRAITDTFEPGSTFKILLAASALESGVCAPSSQFYCEEGTYRIGRKIVHDVHPHESLSLADILKYSSNIGATKVGKEVGPAYLHHKFTEFGIGAKLGVDCPGEASGSLLPVRRWTEIDAAAICFGQGVSLSALQLAAAVSAVANGGLLMKPYLVKEITDVRGRTITSFEPTSIRQVISPETARRVTRMMMRTVQEGGTGIEAAVEGYKVAGKTGTAQKADRVEGGYTDDKYIASFVGFAPAENPVITVLVIIDEPDKKEHYGGMVAAPVFRRIVRETLRYLKVPPEWVPPVPADHGQDSPKQEDDRGPGDPLRVSHEAPAMG
jgi:cell division protein FtsI (penicillin-binding protein 3)